MAQNRTARVLLQYEVDQASSKAAEASAKRLRAEIGTLTQAERDAARQALVMSSGFQATSKQALSLSDAIDKLDKELNEGLRTGELDAIAADFVRIERETNDTNAALIETAKRLRDIGASDIEISRVRSQIDALNAATDRSANRAGKTFGQQVTRLGRVIFNSPDVGPSTDIARGLVGIGAVLDKTGGSLLQLGVAGGLVGVAAVAAAIAFDRFTKSIEASQKVLTAAISAQDIYYEAVRNSTSTQVREQIAELELTERVARQQAMETQAAIDEAFRQAQETFGDATARALDAGGKLPTAQLREQLDGLNKTITTANQAIGRLTQGYNTNAFAANDAAAGVRELNDALLNDAQRGIQFAVRAQNLTRDQRNERIADIYTERTALEQLIAANQENAAVVTWAKAQIDALNKDGEILAAISYSIADAYQQEVTNKEKLLAIEQAALDQERGTKEKLLQIQLAYNEALSKQTDALFDAQTRQADAMQAVFDATQAYNDALQASEDELTEIASDAEAKRLEAFAEANEKQLELDASRDEKLEKQAKEHADRIDKINREANRDILNAIGDRDALAAHLAEQKRQDDLKDEAEKNQKELEQIEEAYKKQQEAIDKALNKQLDRIQKAADKAAETERQRYAKEEQQRQQAILRAQTDAFNAEFALTEIRRTAQAGRVIQEYNHYQQLDSIAGAWLNNIAFRFDYFFQQIAGMVPTTKYNDAVTVIPDKGPKAGGMSLNARNTFNQIIDERLDYHARQSGILR